MEPDTIWLVGDSSVPFSARLSQDPASPPITYRRPGLQFFEKARAAQAAAARGERLTQEQQRQKDEYGRDEKRRLPDAAELAKGAAKWRGRPIEAILVQARWVAEFHSCIYRYPLRSCTRCGRLAHFPSAILEAQPCGAPAGSSCFLSSR